MKLVYGTYGHQQSGKQYVYWADDNVRTGQNLKVPVTHYKSGKTYDTMLTVARTTKADSQAINKETGLNMAQAEEQRLSQQGINIKTAKGTDVMTLPGAKDWANATEWSRWGDLKYEDKVNRLINNFSKEPVKVGTGRLYNRYKEF